MLSGRFVASTIATHSPAITVTNQACVLAPPVTILRNVGFPGAANRLPADENSPSVEALTATVTQLMTKR
ncbi:hypothetical protein NUTIK01_27100 [Novosphingobium sp. IK01]|uniref:Uncharacterized protein n=1 Tax=Novosphingobium pituita TaxID=3056842 RepID=A0ABQ6P9N5_9SPHN|nr:hypothetical protein NUTIK01_27100 [Novosphingobium sp. IK01]